MNHIAKLQMNLEAELIEKKALEEGIHELMSYVSSDKFREEPYVNVQDVLSRCRWVLNDAAGKRVEFENEAIRKSREPRPVADVLWNEEERMYYAYAEDGGQIMYSYNFNMLRKSLIGKGYQVRH